MDLVVSPASDRITLGLGPQLCIITAVLMLVRACIFVGRFHAPFSAFFEVLATSLGRILFRGRISLVNAHKNTSDKAFSVKNHVVFSDPPNPDRQIIIFVQNV